MATCDVCQVSSSQEDTFCPHCGARHRARRVTGTSAPKVGFVGKLLNHSKSLVAESRRSEVDKQVNAIVMGIGHNPQLAVEELENIDDVRRLVDFGRKPPSLSDNSIWHISRIYREAANELARELISSLGTSSSLLKHNAEDMLVVVRQHRQREPEDAVPELSKAFNQVRQAFAPFSPGSPLYHSEACSAQARMYMRLAETIPMLGYGIRPHYLAKRSEINEMAQGRPVQHGKVVFGVCIRPQIPNLRFAEELVWLYEQARDCYAKALELDPSDTKSLLELSQVLGLLGMTDDATSTLDRALTILNKAIQADKGDAQSYIERAEILEELGSAHQALNDLEQALTLTVREYEVQQLKKAINRLREKG